MNTYQGERQLDALGDPSRRAIVARLAQAPSAVGALAEQLPISRPAVSQHLKVLESAGLVRHSAHGTRRVYALDSRGVTDVQAFLAEFWRDDLRHFADHVQAHLDQEDTHGH